MTAPIVATIHVLVRHAVREGRRPEDWLRLFWWRGHAGHPSWEAADPCRATSGLYCDSVGHAPGWRSSRTARPTIVDAAASGVILPWARQAQSVLASLAGATAAESGRRRLVATVRLAVPVTEQGLHPDLHGGFRLTETPPPHRHLLGAHYGSGRGLIVHSPSRADADLSWGRRDSPEWKALREDLAARHAPTLAALFADIGRG